MRSVVYKMKKATETQPDWKDIFLFTKDGRLQSMDLMYSFFLGLGVLFLDFIIGNRLTILLEGLLPSMSRSGKNLLGIILPAVLCALIALLLFRVIRKKKTVLMAYCFGLLLTLIIFAVLFFEFDRETFGLLFPAYIAIFVIPAAVGAVTVIFLFRGWLRNNPDPFREEGPEPEPEEESGSGTEEPDYSGWRQFR